MKQGKRSSKKMKTKPEKARLSTPYDPFPVPKKTTIQFEKRKFSAMKSPFLTILLQISNASDDQLTAKQWSIDGEVTAPPVF